MSDLFRVYECAAANESGDEQVFCDECDCDDKSECGWREFADASAALAAGWWFECAECGWRITHTDNVCDVDGCTHPRHTVECDALPDEVPYHEIEPCASAGGSVWCCPECRDKQRAALEGTP